MKTLKIFTDSETAMSALVKKDSDDTYTVVLRDDDSGLFAGVWKCGENKSLAYDKAKRLIEGGPR